jgi:radical SAM protein with 4Fe4S-binding SPASM domain
MILDLSEYFSKDDKWLYNQLHSIKQDPFPFDFQLTVLYYKDIFNSNTAIGLALNKLQEYLALLDFSNYFVTIKTSYEKIQDDLEKLKNLYCPYDNAIKFIIDQKIFEKIQPVTDSICIFPWIHVYVNPQGGVGPCCNFNEQYPLGSVTTDNLNNIVNGLPMRMLRLQMLAGQRPESCSACWKKEQQGLTSARMFANLRWGEYLNLTNFTGPDGTFADFKLKYLDVRLSNICNLKCRMCSGQFSSRIAQEEASIYNNNSFVDLKLNDKEIKSTLHFIEDNIFNLESIYFAGGEPILMPEHYQILDLLIKYQRHDIEIFYNTNFTVLRYKNLNVVDYWRQFNRVTVGASIDLIGEQAAYVRGGTDYFIIENNYEQVKDYITFNITSIVHLLNIFNLPKLQRHWIESKKLSPTAITFNILIYPAHLSLQILPSYYKELASQYITSHIDWLKQVDNTEKLVLSWQEVLQYMWASDASHLLDDFFRLNDDKDRYRNEKFEEVFPEYINLRSYV